jgi:hypothetical protein
VQDPRLLQVAPMQRPTCSNIRIRSTSDAHKIFFAVQKGLLPVVTRRLDADERLALCSGCVYVWEERGDHSELSASPCSLQAPFALTDHRRTGPWYRTIYGRPKVESFACPRCELVLWSLSTNSRTCRNFCFIMKNTHLLLRASATSLTFVSCLDIHSPLSHASDATRPRDWDPLVKHTYSVSVNTEKGTRKKWHLSVS